MFIWVQVLRGVAAAMVVCHHYVASQAERGADVSRWLLEFGGAGVDIFFVISGFIMMITQSDAADKTAGASAAQRFLLRRLVRIAPLYWVLTALAFGLAALAGAEVHTPIGFDKLLMSMLFLPQGDPGLVMNAEGHRAYVIPMAWTLTYEWFFYLVFSLALTLGLKAFVRLQFIAACFAGCVLAGLVYQPAALLLQLVTSPLLCEFLLGCLVALLYSKGIRLNGAQVVLLALLSGAALVNLQHDSVFARTVTWGFAAFALVIAATLHEGSTKQPAILRPLAWLGDISYSLYLSHFFTLALFVRMQKHLPPLAEGFGVLAIAAYVLLSLLVAELCYRFVEDPARKLLSRPRSGLPAPAVTERAVQPQSGNRYRWVDLAKGIGILLVVYGHIARGIYSAGIEFSERWFKLADSIIYTFHMPLFFFLSGLFFHGSLKKRGAAEMAAWKADTILYPFIVWSLLQGSVELLFSRYTNDAVSVEEVVNLLEPRAQFWFLFALFMITLLAIPLYAALKQRFFLVVMLFSAAVFVFQQALPDFFHADYLYSWFVFFAFGVWFNESKDVFLAKARWLVWPFLALFVFSQWLFHGYFQLTYQDSGAGLLVLAFIAILFVVLLSHELARFPGNFLLQIGYSSMAIYLMHVLAGSGVRVLLQKVLQVENLYAHLALGCAFALLIPIGIVKLCRRWKLMFLIEAPQKISGQYWYQKKLGT